MRVKGWFLHVAMAGMMLCLAGCATSRVPEVAAASAPFSAEQLDQEEVVLRSGVTFSLYVELAGEVEVESELLRVQPGGEAVLPVVGAVRLEGLTLQEASAKLAQAYSSYYVQMPLVRLQFCVDEAGGTSPWGYVTVLGRVAKPGRVHLPPTLDLTVSGAIQDADGFDTSANLAAVRLTRSRKDGSKSQVLINMNKIGEGGDSTQDVRLRAGDVIFVPERIF